ncbi:MAG: hypothetical protein AAB425_01830, partial [Bdellovibrionota bacterium]
GFLLGVSRGLDGCVHFYDNGSIKQGVIASEGRLRSKNFDISLAPGDRYQPSLFFPNGEVESIGRTGGDEGFVKVATVTQPIAIDPWSRLELYPSGSIRVFTPFNPLPMVVFGETRELRNRIVLSEAGEVLAGTLVKPIEMKIGIQKSSVSIHEFNLDPATRELISIELSKATRLTNDYGKTIKYEANRPLEIDRFGRVKGVRK